MPRWQRLQRLIPPVVSLWHRARLEHSTPRQIGCSVSLGVFVGCTPAYGLRTLGALGLASALRLNRLYVLLASRISFSPLYAWIAFFEVESSHRLRTGAWAKLAPHDMAAHTGELLADWLLGAALVGGLLAIVAGVLAYLAARRATQRTPVAPRPQSSESPPSAPPAPTP